MTMRRGHRADGRGQQLDALAAEEVDDVVDRALVVADGDEAAEQQRHGHGRQHRREEDERAHERRALAQHEDVEEGEEVAQGDLADRGHDREEDAHPQRLQGGRDR